MTNKKTFSMLMLGCGAAGTLSHCQWGRTYLNCAMENYLPKVES